MSKANLTRVNQLKDALVSREDAIKKLNPFGKCSVVAFGEKKVSLKALKEDSDATIIKYGSEEFYAEKPAVLKLCRILGVREAYFERLPVSLFYPHLDYLMNGDDFSCQSLIHGEKEGRRKVLGFMKESASYYPISSVFPIADQVSSDYMIEGMDSVSAHGGAIGFVFPQHEFDLNDVGVGDYLYGGVKVKFSIFGDFPISLSVFILTLSCLNGMLSYQEIYAYNRKRFPNVTEDVFVTDGFKNAFGALEKEVDKVKTLTAIPMDSNHIVPYVEESFNNFGIGPRTRKMILEEIISKNPKNMYELLNAITGTTKRLENAKLVYKVQGLGGFVSSHVSKCSTCYRPL